MGLNTFHEHAFTWVPHFDVTRDIPYDFMHVELEGVCKNEFAAMLYYFVRHRDWGFTIDRCNQVLRNYTWPPGYVPDLLTVAIREYCKTILPYRDMALFVRHSIDRFNQAIRNYNWPQGYAPALLTVGELEKGTKQGYCKTGCHVNWTAGDMALFVRHSIDLLEPLIGDTDDVLWKCWVLHAKYVRILMQHSITHAELLELDRCEAYAAVEVYIIHRLETVCSVIVAISTNTQVRIRAPQVVPSR